MGKEMNLRRFLGRRVVSPLLALFLLVSSLPAFAAEAMRTGFCRMTAEMTDLDDDKNDVKYAPDRRVDILHLALDVTPDFEKRSVKGEASLSFVPIAKPLEDLTLNAVDLQVDDVRSNLPLAGYQVTSRNIQISFADPVPLGTEVKLSIKYSAQPSKGLYFRVPSNGYKAQDMHVFTQGEMIEARHWFPCYDHPNEKFTSEVTCHVPEGMTVLSNGKLLSSQKDAQGLLAVRWLQDKQHVNYLITMVAGYFSKLEDKNGRVPLSFYTPVTDAKEAPLTFQGTRSMMDFYENEIQVPFPWDQYGQVVVRDFPPSGMENTSLTTLNDRLLHTSATENILPETGGFTSEQVVAHELAHQWFGDLVTCKDWSHSWLNEGFATFYALLYLGKQHGNDEFLYQLYRDREDILANEYESRPIVYRRYKSPWEQFDQRQYQRASWVLQMLRNQLGEELFRRCVRTYLERYKFQTVVSSDLSRVVEELSGRSYDRFFDQWFYKFGTPKVELRYQYDDKSKMAKISVSQSVRTGSDQKYGENSSKDNSDKISTFHFPLTLRFKFKDAELTKVLDVKEAEETFYVSLKRSPEYVMADPELGLLGTIDFQLPTSMLYARLADKTEMIGRLTAAEQLAYMKDETTIAKLKSAVQNDPFYGVRIRAASSLRKIHTDEALAALSSCMQQSDARVRRAVVEEIGKFYHPQAKDAILRCLETERNPAIIAAALQGLSSYHQDSIHALLLKYLGMTSYNNCIADAAVNAIKMQDDPSFVPELMSALRNRETEFTSHGVAGALIALAYIDRNEKKRDDVREFICGYLSNKRDEIQVGAIRALGGLEDGKSIPVLETFASSLKSSPQQDAAQIAINQLRWSNKPSDNLRDLRNEVLELQKQSREQQKAINDLKQLLEVKHSAKKNDRSASDDKSSRKSSDSSKGN